MPSFERILRDLDIHTCKTPQEKEVRESYYRGLDDARKEVAIIVGICAVIYVTIRLVCIW